ncbi:MAG TPA: DUF881 domain-containing protein [Symbiobacteriaceae bacterium]|nr:DUF881 domain-containing protein [Symbiobacteriaceae bacterium]
MSRTRHIPWAIALVCVVLGFMLSMQFKVQKQVRRADSTAFMRAQELAQQLEKAEEERDALMAENESLRTQLTKVVTNQAEFKDLAAQLEQAQVHAGLVAMTGPGVVVELRDSPRPVTQGENPNNFIIHDSDVLQVVNELLSARAEAISINEQRVVGRTEIRCAGATITINGVRTAPPVIIKAIGNPNDLEAVLTMKGGVAETLQPWGVQLTVRKEQTIDVPAFKGSLKLQFGAPAKQEVKTP